MAAPFLFNKKIYIMAKTTAKIEEPIQYEEGEYVLLRPDFPSTWSRRMNRYVGRTVRIRTAGSTQFYIDQDEEDNNTDYVFSYERDVVRKATKEEIKGVQAEKEAAKEKARLEKEEYMKEMVYKSKDINDIVLDVFPEDRVDFVEINENSCKVTLYFPDIDITNTNETKHHIKDLYVRMELNYNGDTGYHVALTGKRGQISLKEYKSDLYGHSHLNGCWGYGNFCLGNSDFSSVVNQLMASCRQEDWYMLFLSLENYLKWESLEGGPYRKIEQLGYKVNVNTSQINTEFERLLPLMPEEFFSWNDGVQYISTHPGLFHFYNENSTIKSMSAITNEQVEQQIADINTALSRDGKVVTFKGQKIQQKVYNEGDIQDAGTISQDVIDQYNVLLNKKIQEFNKNITYVRAKELYHTKVFGEIGVKQ